MQYYLPPEDVINKDFLKEVLAGQKQLLTMAEVKQITVPHYDELSVKALWPDVKKDAKFLSFFPSKYPKGKAPPREYFFNVLNTLQPEYLEQIIAHANEVRMAADGEKQQHQAIEISPFWEQQLKSMPYISSKYRPILFISALLPQILHVRQLLDCCLINCGTS